MNLLYYITSHGYGHAVRSVAICNRLPEGCNIFLRTTVPRLFFEKEISRPFGYEPAAFDCGCVQPDADTVDIQKTLAAYRSIADNNRRLLDNEAAWCEKKRIDVIVSDIVPFAFDAAKKTGIPSVAATNFTWHTIYEEYSGQCPGFAPYLAEMSDQYAAADLLLELYPANRMGCFGKRIKVGPVGRRGKNVRRRLCAAYGVSKEKKLGLIYAGDFGLAAVPWHRLAMLDKWEFFGLYPLPGAPGNYHRISKDDFRYQDCIASADAMIGKLGYGVCAECFINGLPLIFLPRSGFAEYPVLEKAVEKWGHGHLLSREDFIGLAWRDALDEVSVRKKPQPMESGGAQTCAAEIERLA